MFSLVSTSMAPSGWYSREASHFGSAGLCGVRSSFWWAPLAEPLAEITVAVPMAAAAKSISAEGGMAAALASCVVRTVGWPWQRLLLSAEVRSTYYCSL